MKSAPRSSLQIVLVALGFTPGLTSDHPQIPLATDPFSIKSRVGAEDLTTQVETMLSIGGCF